MIREISLQGRLHGFGGASTAWLRGNAPWVLHRVEGTRGCASPIMRCFIEGFDGSYLDRGDSAGVNASSHSFLTFHVFPRILFEVHRGGLEAVLPVPRVNADRVVAYVGVIMQFSRIDLLADIVSRDVPVEIYGNGNLDDILQ